MEQLYQGGCLLGHRTTLCWRGILITHNEPRLRFSHIKISMNFSWLRWKERDKVEREKRREKKVKSFLQCDGDVFQGRTLQTPSSSSSSPSPSSIIRQMPLSFYIPCIAGEEHWFTMYWLPFRQHCSSELVKNKNNSRNGFITFITACQYDLHMETPVWTVDIDTNDLIAWHSGWRNFHKTRKPRDMINTSDWMNWENSCRLL